MTKKIYFMGLDDKAKIWQESGKKIGLEILSPSGNGNGKFLIFIIKSIFGQRPDAIVIRYLNDRRSLVTSILLFFYNILIISISKAVGLRIIWFCHNVDKESVENYPYLTRILRYVLGSFSSVIYVLDELLIDVFKEKYPQFKDKVDYISFGIRDGWVNNKLKNKKSSTDAELLCLIKKLNAKKTRGNVFVGFCPTGAAEKILHIKYAVDLVNKFRGLGLELYLIIVGDLEVYFKENPGLEEQIKLSPTIYLTKKYIFYDPSEVSSYIDFYWRSLSDQSVSYTLYEAATQKKPILTLDFGFLSKAVSFYNMGQVLDVNLNNLEDAIRGILLWDSQSAELFLKNHTWDVAVSKIKLHLESTA